MRFGNFDGERVPKGWDLEQIVAGATQSRSVDTRIPLSRVQEAKILIWKISEDSRPVRIQQCTAWIRLDHPIQWMLAHAVRHKYSDDYWSDWSLAWREHSDPFWVKGFSHPPTSQEIETFLDATNGGL